MKLTFRVTQFCLFLLLLAPTVGVIGGAAYWAVRATSDDLSSQLFDQTSLRIDGEVQALLDTAVGEAVVASRLVSEGVTPPEERARLVHYLREVMQAEPRLTATFVGFEASGETSGVSRLDGELRVWELRREADDSRTILTYRVDDYPTKPLSREPNCDYDVRQRPWYRAAHANPNGAWTEAYVFSGVVSHQETIGVTYAQPVLGPDQKVAGVVGADFEVQQLSHFLQGLQIGQTGLACVVETTPSGAQRVLAHPQASALLLEDAAGPRLPLAEEFSHGPTRDAIQAVQGQPLCTRDPDGKIRSPPVRFLHEGVAYLAQPSRLTGEHVPNWTILVLVPEAELLAQAAQILNLTLCAVVLSACLAIGLSLYFASQVSQPLEQLARDAAAIGRLELSSTPAPRSVVMEVDRLAQATQRMKAGLLSFQKYVPGDVVRELIAEHREAVFGGERRCVTLMFSDIVGFTSQAEKLSPEELVDQLREYFNVIGDEIARTGGVVDKYIGDAVMALWNAPSQAEGHALAACRAGLAIQHALSQARERWQASGKPPMETRIGIHTGEAIVGNFGSDLRLTYTALGDNVNLASRIEGINGRYGTLLLISGDTWAAAGEAILARPVDLVAVKGKSKPVELFELLALRESATAEQVRFAARCQAAFADYRLRRWSSAREQWQQLADHYPEDLPIQQLLHRAATLEFQPVDSDHDGVFYATNK